MQGKAREEKERGGPERRGKGRRGKEEGKEKEGMHKPRQVIYPVQVSCEALVWAFPSYTVSFAHLLCTL